MSDWDEVSTAAPQTWDDVSAPVGDDNVQAPQITGTTRLPALAGSSLASGLGKAVSTPGDLAQLYEAYIGAPTARAISTLGSVISPSLGTSQPLDFGVVDPTVSKQLNAVLPDTSTVTHDLSSAGIVNRSDLVPQTPTEKFLASGAEGLGSVLPYMVGAGLPGALNMAAQGAGSGILDQASQKYFPDNDSLRFAADLTGGLGGGKLASTASQAANAVTSTSSILQAYKDAGVTPRMVGDVTGNGTLQTLQNIGGNKGAQQTLDEFGRSVENLAGNFGNASTLQEAGTFAQKDAKDWLSNANATDQKNWGVVDQKIGPSAPVMTNNTQNTLASIQSRAGDNEAARSFLTSDIGKTVDKIVKESPVNNFDYTTGSRNVGYDPLQWQTASALRTRIGEYLSNPTSIADAGHAQAKQLYSALTNDMQSTALANGKDALQSFQQANAYTAQKHNFVDNVISNISGKDPETAAKSLISSGVNGGTTLQAIRQNMPDTADQLAAVSLRRMGAGQSEGASGNAVSPSRWLSNQDPVRRMSPEAYQALFNDPAAQKTMGALDTVADRMRATEKAANSSKTAGHAAWYAGVPATLGGAVAGYHEGGLLGAGVGALPGLSAFAVKPTAAAISNNQALAKFLTADKGVSNLSPSLGLAAQQQLYAPFSWAPAQ